MKQHEKTILFLPFLQIPSGHHQAANAIIDSIEEMMPHVQCKKVDILSYSYGRIENLVSQIYLKWIQYFPNIYNLIYQASVYRKLDEDKRYRLYELLFLPFMKRLLNDVRPDLIVCTHALPSYMLNYLKKKELIKIPIINIYTDYFIHRFWGVHHIDFHFVPSIHVKDYLIKKGIPNRHIYHTGIPIHKKITIDKQEATTSNTSYKILLTGGNLGVGEIEKLLKTTEENNGFHYYVLCGKNEVLFNKLKKLNRKHITPLTYISCREKMNALYESIDGIVTKPGGVTISEALYKKKPIFIYHALPGQERINLEKLTDLGVVTHLQNWASKEQSLESQLRGFFENDSLMNDFFQKLNVYHQHLNEKKPAEIIRDLLHNA
ncbi:UDP-glucuronosyltransferase [Cytobacillus sp. FJAT-54145]|uniref:UDP-glucuronosyltransferase n=1 Tax=Cytobacillus spartinae TaxID=3299023 RepID=A0ABW6KIL8_9BACI